MVRRFFIKLDVKEIKIKPSVVLHGLGYKFQVFGAHLHVGLIQFQNLRTQEDNLIWVIAYSIPQAKSKCITKIQYPNSSLRLLKKNLF